MTSYLVAGIWSESVYFFAFNKKKRFHAVSCFFYRGVNNLAFNADGDRVVFCNSYKLIVVDIPYDFEVLHELEVSDIESLQLSPCGRVAATYKKFRTDSDNPNGYPNLHFIDLNSKETLLEVKHRQGYCWAPQWTNDSSFCARNQDGEIQVYTDNNFATPAASLSAHGIQVFAVTKYSANIYLAVYIPARHSEPCSVRIFRWFNRKLVHHSTKSFYCANEVSLYWNDSGTDLLILISGKEKDKHRLHFMTTETSVNNAILSMPRPGPIHRVTWKPNGKFLCNRTDSRAISSKREDELFAVSYGYYPAFVALFGIQCEPLHNLETGPSSLIIFNSQGNLMLLGCLSSKGGCLSVWDVNEGTTVSKFITDDEKFVDWVPDGKYMILATTAPVKRYYHQLNLRNTNGGVLFNRQNVVVKQDETFGVSHSLQKVIVSPRVDRTPPSLENSEGQRKRIKESWVCCFETDEESNTSTVNLELEGDVQNKQTEPPAAAESGQYSYTPRKTRKRKRKKKKGRGTKVSGAPERDAKTGILTEALFRLSM